MNSSFSIRHAIHPTQSKTFTTSEMRQHYLIDTVFIKDHFTATYTLYDRLIVGGAAPGTRAVELTPLDVLKADYFLERRELGIINVGAEGKVEADGQIFTLGNKEALYVARETKSVKFLPNSSGDQPLFYFNSAPAHHVYPTTHITLAKADTVEMGSVENANQRTIRKLIVNSVVKTCQLQMGLTELKTGSVWNTMPPHTHDRRMEAYFYFNVPANQSVCHFMGEPNETRNIWIQNHQAVISPPWSIHSGAGTSNYAFIWGMAGENLDYADMDIVQPSQLR